MNHELRIMNHEPNSIYYKTLFLVLSDMFYEEKIIKRYS